MPKNKKAKIKHNASKNNAELSQAEIWDDSALIRSWNDAVAEYEYYHSIHVRGEDVEEILRRAEMGELDDDMLAETDMKGVSGEWHDANPESEATAIPLAGENDAEVEDGEIEDGEVELGKELAAAKAALGRQVQGDAAVEQHTSRPTAGGDGGDVAGTVNAQPPHGQHTASSAVPFIGPSLPAATTTSSQGPSPDQTLENIKMAYYWAGYYSGLYDGQRQTQAQAQAQASATVPAQSAAHSQNLPPT